mgnify:CR=1 FL=1
MKLLKMEDMNMTKTNLNDLLEVLEQIRAEKYPDVPKDLVEKIALSQYDNQDNRDIARSNTMRIIADYMNNIKGM